jgi:hypothetical protein
MCIHIAPIAVKIINIVINPVETNPRTLANMQSSEATNDALAKLLEKVFTGLLICLIRITKYTTIITPGKNQLETVLLIH